MNEPARAELLGWLKLNAASAVGTDRLRRLVENLGWPGVQKAPEEQLAQAAGIALESARLLRRGFDAFDAQKEYQRCQDLGLHVLAWDEPGYPELLRSTSDAPLVLYVWGELESGRDALAVVGSRQATAYGRRMTRALVQEAAQRFVIVSGLARGIDTEAHRTALESGGTTWAVLGSGLGRIYPAENAELAQRIASGRGCLISEFPLDEPPLSQNFPRRNRIVSGLSWGTLVVEGREHSGALITARLATQQGREVFAVPGPADSPLSDAPLRLISQGAKMVRCMADVWAELPPGCQPQARAPGARAIAAEHQKILQLLGSETRSVAELGVESGLDVPSLTQALLEMELQDLVEAVPGQRYAKKSVN